MNNLLLLLLLVSTNFLMLGCEARVRHTAEGEPLPAVVFDHCQESREVTQVTVQEVRIDNNTSVIIDGITTKVDTTPKCNFRLKFNNNILSWSGENNWGNEQRFAKCKMLHPGDQLEVISFGECLEGKVVITYLWRSGTTRGVLY